ncbi:MAG: hypothetical protein KCHDKBKB_02455 [Elusimicrobia bacterium]|nr:hypothetical protein [Elusimicrobiota bacterium]
MRKKLSVSICLLSFWTTSVHAGESPPCEITTAQDILSCALKNHPDLLRAEIQLKNLGAYDTLARQRPNPELESEAASQNGDDNPSFKAQAAYLHTIELGSKRKRRGLQATAQKDLILARAALAKEEVARKTVLNLHRLRQISSEKKIVDEALSTFATIIKQYKSRPALSPEQNVSLNAFILAQGLYVLKNSALSQEQELLKAYFDIATGVPFETVLENLPEKKGTWPSVEASTEALTVRGSQLQASLAQAAVAKSEFDLAASAAKPDLEIGPMVEIERGRNQDSESYGGALNLPLPLYQQNQGGIALAKAESEQADLSAQLRRRELNLELQALMNNYRHAVSSFKNIPTVSQMEAKHKNMEELFERGIVSAALIIEAHRLMAEFAKEQNEHELKAIEALWTIYALQGKILEERL